MAVEIKVLSVRESQFEKELQKYMDEGFTMPHGFKSVYSPGLLPWVVTVLERRASVSPESLIEGILTEFVAQIKEDNEFTCEVSGSDVQKYLEYYKAKNTRHGK